MEAALERLLDSPKLGLYVEQLQEALRAEQARRGEFLASIQEGDKAEFINGEPVIHSPVRFAHNNASFLLCSLLHTHAGLRGLGRVGHEKLMVSLSRNDYEPDVCFWAKEKSAAFAPQQLRFPAPDFIAEVLSEGTEAIDRGVKFVDYAAHGVAEYWIVDPDREIIEQYALRGEEYRLQLKVDSGRLKSLAVPGFEIPVRAVFDKAENLAALAEMLQAAARGEP